MAKTVHRRLQPWREVVRTFLREPAFRSLLAAACIVLLVGTIFYHFTEDWSWLDSLYFSTITLTTIGYGDFAPTTDLTRFFTIIYVLVGLGIITSFITAVASARLFVGDDPAVASRGPEMQVLKSDAATPPTRHVRLQPRSRPRRNIRHRVVRR